MLARNKENVMWVNPPIDMARKLQSFPMGHNYIYSHGQRWCMLVPVAMFDYQRVSQKIQVSDHSLEDEDFLH